jgi:hypothetical protein
MLKNPSMIITALLFSTFGLALADPNFRDEFGSIAKVSIPALVTLAQQDRKKSE